MKSELCGESQLLESRHQCQIYAGPPSRQLPALAVTIQRKLEEGYRCLYLNSRPMVTGIRSSLAALGMDVGHEVAQARLILSSEPVTSVGGGFDVDRMLSMLENALDQALNDGYKGLWAAGDMTWEFGHEKNFVKLLEYEHRLEDLFCRRPELCGICQYHQDTLPPEVARQGLLTHRTIFINETLSRMNPHYVRPELSNAQMTQNPQIDQMIVALCQAPDMKS